MKRILRHFEIILSLTAFIAAIILPELWEQLAIFGLFIVLGIANSHRKEIFTLFIRMSVLLIFTLLVHLFFRFGEGNYWQAFGEAALWTKALFFTARNGNILLIMSFLIKSGEPISISSIITRLEGKKPAKFIQPLTLAMRYVGLIRDEFRSLQQVHRIMGIKKPKHFIAQAKYYTSLIAPTIISSLERAEHLSIALTSRGYNQS